ncbi:MAG: HEAT repeat domain-containing protein [Methanotrichaceae archaeon]
MSSIDTSDIGDAHLPLCDPENMPSIADTCEVDALVKLLEDVKQDHHLRCVAARKLGDIGDLKSARALCIALEDKYPSIRFEAIAALGKIGGKQADEALSNLLECDSIYVRGLAARALIQISGVPDSKEENLERLLMHICSGDRRIKKAVLDIGSISIDLLTMRLGSSSFIERQEAAATLALHIRELIDHLPSEETVFSWLARQGFPAKFIAGLYSFRIIRTGETVDKVENSGFDAISKTLCGDRLIRLILRLSSEAFDHPQHDSEIANINLKDLISEHIAGEFERAGFKRMGRTLITPINNAYLAIKLCTNEEDAALLSTEVRMQRMLASLKLSSRLPRPLGGLLKLQGLSDGVQDLKLSDLSEPYAICYIADSDYFRYLGDPSVSTEKMKEILASCAADLGRLTRSGIIHTSLIPLYHRRERLRGDSTYCWNRKVSGRLDNWLESCMYPNLRLSGIADLEHIEIYPEISARALQSYAGEHLLSMSLVLGSYFYRRDRFDENAFAAILKECFLKYCCALAGSCDIVWDDLFCSIDWIDLARRMAEEMSRHRVHSTETGRAKIASHLGRPYGPFPIPELIRAIHITSLFAVLELQACSRG